VGAIRTHCVRWRAAPTAAVGATAALVLSAVAPAQVRKGTVAEGLEAGFRREVLPVVQQACLGCHSGSRPAGGVALGGFKTAASAIKARPVWEKVAENVRSGHMPPAGAPPLSAARRERLVAWIESALSQADCDLRDPGRVTMRRLNRAEYNNTIRDLFGMDLRPADSFPNDDVGYGFDNIGDVLSISPLLLEKYVDAAERISRAVIAAPETSPRAARWEAEALSTTPDASFATSTHRIVARNGEVWVDHAVPVEGDYTLRVFGYGRQSGNEPVKMELRVDGKPLETFLVRVGSHLPKAFEAKVRLVPGSHRFAAAFLNEHAEDADMSRRQVYNRNLVLDWMEVEYPAKAGLPLPPFHLRVLATPPAPGERETAARRILSSLAPRAWRRPVTPAEVDRLLRVARLAERQGESFERGLQLAIQAVLVSPHFLFRSEPDPPAGKAERLLNGYELASRLSYFLWSSMPDAQLTRLAASGALKDPKVLAAQARRMLKDPRAAALAENFAGQWLTLRNLETVSPDPRLFPGFTPAIRDAMRRETELFFTAVVREDRSVLDFLNGRFTYVNEELARHYGIPGVRGGEFRKVALQGDQRAGILTHGSILTLTSNPTRTSPVKRGKWILEQILGTPPPPPPPNTGDLEDEKRALTGTFRQKLEQHRQNPSCASCHNRMDPIGFAFENYDPVGAWRTREGDAPVDASGTLPDGRSFHTPAEFRAILLDRKAQFVRCLSEKLLTYALGRGVEARDRCHVEEIARRASKSGWRFSALVEAVVQSDPFRKKRLEGRKG